MLKARIHRHVLHFRQPAGTSRGILNSREAWYIHVWDDQSPDVTGIGECCMLPGLSADDRPDYPEMLDWICRHISGPPEILHEKLAEWPSIRFGLEMALLDLKAGGSRVIFPSDFTRGISPIPINGLVWMGNKDFMLKQISEKIDQGFRVIKIKVGAIDFASECELLGFIRNHYPEDQIEIRLDANGAFGPEEAPSKLETLSAYGIHSIEQPIRAGQPETMERLCRISPIPVALDEELIGINHLLRKQELVSFIRPHYLILKPSLLGGFAACNEWIEAAVRAETGWWVTSALESNIGLNAIAQWTATLDNPLPQGLGTGALYTNNVPSPLKVTGGQLWHFPRLGWEYRNTGLSGVQDGHDLSLVVDGQTYTRKMILKQAGFWLNVSDEEPWLNDLGDFLTKWFSSDEPIDMVTSGSTGVPKQIRLSRDAIIASALATGEYLGLHSHRNALLCLSPRYIAGMMMVVRAMVWGLNLVTVKPGGNPLLQEGLEEVPEFAAMVPAQVYNSLRDPVSANRLSAIRTLIVGGGEIPPDLEKQLEAMPNAVYATYGMTETVSHIALRRVSGPGRQGGYTTLPGITVSTDSRGCLVVDAPAITGEKVVTNDLAEVYDEHSFRWLGRYDNIINRGGQKLIPEEIEKQFRGILKERFIVGGFPDPRFGEVPVMVIESEGVEPDRREKLEAFIRTMPVVAERPAEIFLLPLFPETGTGKINRKITMSQIQIK